MQPTYTCGEHRGLAALYPFPRNGCLQNLLNQKHKFTATLINHITDLLTAIDTLHQNGITHGDLTTNTIYIASDTSWKIVSHHNNDQALTAEKQKADLLALATIIETLHDSELIPVYMEMRLNLTCKWLRADSTKSISAVMEKLKDILEGKTICSPPKVSPATAAAAAGMMARRHRNRSRSGRRSPAARGRSRSPSRRRK